MTTALIVGAHCDDEFIWLYDAFCNRDIERRVFVASCDKDNPDRNWCSRAEDALRAICADVGIEDKNVRVLDGYYSEFYRLPTRGAYPKLFRHWWDAAQEVVKEMMVGCDFISTFNEWGSYGMRDHIEVRRMVEAIPNRPLMRWNDGWYLTMTWPIADKEECKTNGRLIGQSDLSIAEYQRLSKFYLDRGCHTWDHCCPSPVNIYEEVR